MTKDEIIASLLDQLKDTNNQVTALTGRVNELLAKVAELTAIIKALQEEKGAKEKTLRKANNTISRRSSLFFGSHKGAERAAVLYTLALSAKMNHLNLFDYLADILDRTATWQPNTPLEKYRNLLPDCWQPSKED
ncbi:MAG: hypothetical protein PUI88_03240 [Prevotella sp.]|jgi:D-arabinose 5-phosphate isomerase GutQ|nr:hypothetical protein [Prevotella sp.]MDD7127709.1 hypothetical protein [Prevotella sp.]